MKWKFTDDRPLYLQAAALIRGAVFSGEFPPGSRIPSVRELAAQARVNPNTMQRAMAELERDGLVHSQRTAGRFVTEDGGTIAAARRDLARHHLEQFLSAMAGLGYERAEIEDLLGQELEKEE